MQTLRLAIAFIIAPAVPILLFDAYILLTTSAPHPSFYPASLMQGFAPIAYGCAFVGGLPLYLIFKRRRLFRWWHYAVGGAAIGSLPGACLFVSDFISVGGSGFALYAVGIGVPYGALAGLTLWTIGIRGAYSRVGV
jgi:hypothetical protein